MSALADVRSCSVSTAGFEDGLGRRSVRFDREVGGMLECLHVRPELGLFETVLRETAERIAALEDERFARVRTFERDSHGLVVVSELVPGERLSDVLDNCRHADTPVAGLDTALGFLLQALPALARLHAAGITHGAVGPERIIITPASQVVLVDALYAAALDRLRLNRRTLWTTLSIMSPPAAGATRFDPRLDVGQIALAALALALGRPISTDTPSGLSVHLDEVSEVAQIRGGERFSDAVRLLFTSTLLASTQGRGASADEAASNVQRLAREIGQDTVLAALTELVRYQTQFSEVDAAPTAVLREMPVLPAAPVPVQRLIPVPVPVAAPVPPPVIDAQLIAPSAPVPQAASVAPPVFVAREQVPSPPTVRVPLAPVFMAPPPPSIPEQVVVAAAPPAPIAPPPVPVPVPVPTLRIKTEAPSGYTPPRVVANTEPLPKALPYVNRGNGTDAPSKFPWKLAAAAVLVTVVGVVAGRDYLNGRADVVSAAPQIHKTAAAPLPRAAAAAMGSLSVVSQPEGARVALDGADVGITPLVMDKVTPGRHIVTLTTDALTVRKTIRVEEGKQATLDVPMFSGWIAVFSPITLHVSAGTRSLGTSDTGRILLPPGRHVLTFSSKEFGFRATQAVDVVAGEVQAINLAPKATVNLNAQPWAEVWVDGTRAGETPLANLQVALGTREFVFRHPQHGERKLTATITAAGAALSVDFTKPGIQP